MKYSKFWLNLGFSALLTTLVISGGATADTSDTLKPVVSENSPVDLVPAPKHLQSSRYIAKIISDLHYSRPRLNNAESTKVLTAYIKGLDGNKAYFLQSDIDSFQRYKNNLDNAILTGWLKPAYQIYDIFQLRWKERINYALTLLDTEMNFDDKEYFYYDREDKPWATQSSQLDEFWRQRVKSEALNLVLADKTWDEAKELLTKRYKAALRRVNQVNNEDVFSYFMNAYANTVDPHTSYFSPQTAENFDIDMKLSLEGIGAVLQTDDVYTKINRIVEKGPADKSGKLAVDDRVIAVGQGKEPMVDVVGWRLDDVVKLIRGDAGTVVRLEIEPANATVQGKTKIISIVREKVKLEEQAAKSDIIEIDDNGETKRIGVIDLPKFYVDFKAKYEGKENYRSTTRDIRKLINDMKAEKGIDGLIIDLRSNGGGALDEATALTGLFIDKGPVVQDRNRRGRVEVLGDDDPGVAWDGPLAVLVNGGSASASEIFAGAIQDYGRGLIIGENTFGKGTVQRVYDLNNIVRSEDHDYGALKLTINKFYRISGESTQLKGVKPDISYPDPIPRDEFGESSYDAAMAWDKIPPANYQKDERVKDYVDVLEKMHEKRIKAEKEFQYLITDIDRIKERRQQKRISLNFAERKAERDADKAIDLARENERRKLAGKPVIKEIDENTELTDAKDAKLIETAHIVSDLFNIKERKKLAMLSKKEN